MTNTLGSLSTAQLRQALEIRERIESLEGEFAAILGGATVTRITTAAPSAKPAGKSGMSAAGRAAIIAAQKARWAKFHASKNGGAKASTAAAPTKPKRTMSAAGRARIAAAARARWKKAKAAGKTRL
jgi:hypothetical protein